MWVLPLRGAVRDSGARVSLATGHGGWTLTDFVQVQALGVVADEALQEGVAVLGRAEARLHRLACSRIAYAHARHSFLHASSWYCTPTNQPVAGSCRACSGCHAFPRRQHDPCGMQSASHVAQAGRAGTFPDGAVDGLDAAPRVDGALVRDVRAAAGPVLGRRRAVGPRSAHGDLCAPAPNNVSAPKSVFLLNPCPGTVILHSMLQPVHNCWPAQVLS